MNDIDDAESPPELIDVDNAINKSSLGDELPKIRKVPITIVTGIIETFSHRHHISNIT